MRASQEPPEKTELIDKSVECQNTTNWEVGMIVQKSCNNPDEIKYVMASLDNLSKCARRKFKRYGKIPAEFRSSSPKIKRLTRAEYLLLGLQIQSGTQEHLWRKGEQIIQRKHFIRWR
jgi:hypothetical protein